MRDREREWFTSAAFPGTINENDFQYLKMDLARRLRSRGYRVTPQREAVYRVLAENEGQPLSPEGVHALARAEHAGLGLTTVYRTLELFCDLGIAFPVHLRGGARFYEINQGKHHHHMECLSCGTVELLEVCLIDDIVELVRDGSDFLVTSHCMSLFGYCPRCLEGREGLRAGRWKAGRAGGAGAPRPRRGDRCDI